MSAEEELLAADGTDHPSIRSSPHRLPLASVVDLHPRRRHPSPLGELTVHRRAAGAVALPICGHPDRFERGPLDRDPTAAYRFD